MTEKEYKWRFAKAMFDGLVKDARRNEVLQELLGTGPRAVYAGLLMCSNRVTIWSVMSSSWHWIG